MRRRTLLKLAIALGVGNYGVYVLAILLAGGDVLHGQVVQGHYFAVADGRFIEIGHALYQFCRWQAYSLLVTFPLGLWAGFHLTPVQHDPDELVLSRGD